MTDINNDLAGLAQQLFGKQPRTLWNPAPETEDTAAGEGNVARNEGTDVAPPPSTSSIASELFSNDRSEDIFNN
ncbi:hypothetical protein [Microbacterium sp.]|uniref:hypothetical protein n=1 Tax=Microbacterium sp. TaxID=51671 RepID=UPI00260E589B|nr:hypothetical protein [Microbacterium sp.]MCV0334084.1 hypothetical protein [Microbacterium sp.]MCV0374388.1 hypothetical protein [Microbacterium sp.]MCV0389460.1 hypothetical protein [Microbacterium sp.]MCV0418994.1 hypothetical protein [Microbacterium sp.]MCV0421300.1 hypothetical protein [Microbacterium sp.]